MIISQVVHIAALSSIQQCSPGSHRPVGLELTMSCSSQSSFATLEIKSLATTEKCAVALRKTMCTALAVKEKLHDTWQINMK